MASAGTVNVNLVAQTAAFHSAMSAAEGTLRGFHSTIETGARLLEAYLGYEAIAHITEWVHHTMEAVEHQTRLADSLGVSTEAMQALSYSTTIAGGSAEVLGAAMLKMEENLSGVGGQTTKTVDALKAMGMTMADLQGRSGDEQMMLIADGMQKVSSAGERAKISVDLFGKAGAQLLPILNQGSERLREQAKEAAELGLTYNRIDAEKIMSANEALKKAGEVMEGGLVAMTKELSPLIEGVVNYFVDAAKEAGGFGTIATKAMDFIVKSIGVAADAINVLIAGWDATKVAIAIVVRGIADFGVVASVVVIRVGDYFQNFATALGNTGRFISRMWDLVWETVKFGAAMAVSVMGEKFAGLMRDMSVLAGFVNSSLAASIRSAADKISESSKAMHEDHVIALQNAIEDTKFAAKEMGSAWKGIFTSTGEDENPVVNFFKGLSSSANTAGEDAAMHFLKTFEKVVGQDASRAWEAWYVAQKEASDRHAREEAARIEQERANARAIAAEKLAVDTQLAAGIKANLSGTVLAENEAFTKRLDDLKRYHDEALLSDAEFKQAEADAQRAHQRRLSDITVHEEAQVTQWEVMNQKEKVAFTTQTLNNLATLMQSHNKRAFEIGKAAAYASTVISTAQAAMESYKALAGIPYVGPYLGAVAAAAAIAAGAVQLATISSAHFDSGGGGVSSGSFSGASAVTSAAGQSVGPGQGNQQQQAPGVTGQDRPGQGVTIVVNSKLHDAAIREVADGLNEYLRNGGKLGTVTVQS